MQVVDILRSPARPSCRKRQRNRSWKGAAHIRRGRRRRRAARRQSVFGGDQQHRQPPRSGHPCAGIDLHDVDRASAMNCLNMMRGSGTSAGRDLDRADRLRDLAGGPGDIVRARRLLYEEGLGKGELLHPSIARPPPKPGSHRSSGTGPGQSLRGAILSRRISSSRSRRLHLDVVETCVDRLLRKPRRSFFVV